jgi:hypothetical protein
VEDTLLLLGVKGRRPNFIRQGLKIHVAGELQRVGQAWELPSEFQRLINAVTGQVKSGKALVR